MPQRLSDVDLASLVPETKTWNNGDVVSLGHWIFAIGSFEHMIAYGELFWPDFVEHDGCILRAGFSEESYLGFLEQTGGDKRAVEAVINHVHIFDLISKPEGPSDEQAAYLGRLLQEMWRAKLEREFPGRAFIVCYDQDDDDTVYVHQDWEGHPTG